MKRMFLAESAILLHFKPIGVVLFVLHGVVVSLLAFGTSESDFNAHYGTSLIASLYHCGYFRFRGSRSIRPQLKKSAQKKSPFSQVGRLYHIPPAKSMNNFVFLRKKQKLFD
jgi:hypothetical protein